MIARFAQWQGRDPESVAADATYGNGEFLQWLMVSTTDPDPTYATKGGTPARLGYYDNYLVDHRSCVIVGVQATAARMSQETVAAQNSSCCCPGSSVGFCCSSSTRY
jgi:hypothetical protein